MSVEVSRLANGITVITEEMERLETVALGIWVRAGARDESAAENGIAHLLEHMAFKGTSRRSARDIAEQIEDAGGEVNASTAMETTAYYARVLKEDWRLGLDVLADILTDPVFDADELDLERQVILQEIAAANDTPDDLVFDLAHQRAYPDHPLGRSILGSSASMGALDRRRIADYRTRHYAARRLVVAAAGAIEHEALLRETERLLGGLGTGEDEAWGAPAFSGGEQHAQRPLDQTHLVFAFPAVSYRDDGIYSLHVLSSILGGGMSSRLFQEVREQRGLCYSVFSHGSAYRDSGLMTVYAATSPEKAGDLAQVLCDVMLSMTDHIDAKEVDRAKAQIRAGLVMSLESPSARADQIARQHHAFGRVPDMAETLQRVADVTPHKVQGLASQVFGASPPVYSAVGDLKELASYDRIAARFA